MPNCDLSRYIHTEGLERSKKVKGTGFLEVQDRSCRLDDEPAAVGSPYCWPHYRTRKDICKKATKDKKSQLYIDYVAIFGAGKQPPPDPSLADRVILEHHEARRLAAEAGQAMPDCDLSRYIHTEGHRPPDPSSADRKPAGSTAGQVRKQLVLFLRSSFV